MRLIGAASILLALASLLPGLPRASAQQESQAQTSQFQAMQWRARYPSTPLPKIGNGLFTIRIVSDPSALKIQRLEAIIVEIRRANGRPVNDANVAVAVRARDVERRMQTAPRITRNLGLGKYRVEGLRFTMHGSWLLEFEVTSQSQTDKTLLEVLLK